MFVTPTGNENVGLIRRVMIQIKVHPEMWDQGQYGSCGTAHCFAGWALVLNRGEEWMNSQERLSLGAFDVAEDDLGLTFEQAWALFESSATKNCSFDEYAALVTEVTGVEFE